MTEIPENKPSDRPNAGPKTRPCPLPIVLVGMMGVGKTSIGRRLAPRLGLPFHDADEEIEQAAGMKVVDIFAEHGEDAFRDGEARVIKRLIEGPPIVLATGGGAILREETRRLIRKSSLSIWLHAPLDIIVERATRRPTRPLLRNNDPHEVISRLLKEREAFYADASLYQVESQTGSHSKTVNLINTLITEHLTKFPETSTQTNTPSPASSP